MRQVCTEYLPEHLGSPRFTENPSGAPGFAPVLVGIMLLNRLVLSVVFCISLFVLLSFFNDIIHVFTAITIKNTNFIINIANLIVYTICLVFS